MTPFQCWREAHSRLSKASNRYEIGEALILGSKAPEKVFSTFSDKAKYPNPGAWTLRGVLSIGFDPESARNLLAFCKDEARESRPSPVRVAARMLGYTEWTKANDLVKVVRLIRKFRKEGSIASADLVTQHLNENGIKSAKETLRHIQASSDVPKSSPVESLTVVQGLLRDLRKDCHISAQYPLEQAIAWVNAAKEVIWTLETE